MSRPQPHLFLRHATRCDAGSISLSHLSHPAAGRENTTPSTLLAWLTLLHLLTTANLSLDLNRAIRYTVSPTTTTSLIDRHQRPSLDPRRDATRCDTHIHPVPPVTSPTLQKIHTYIQVHTGTHSTCIPMYSKVFSRRGRTKKKLNHQRPDVIVKLPRLPNQTKVF